MMEKISKLILAHNPVTTCNFRCAYCYITQHKQFDNALPVFPYSAEEIRKALSQKRLGGPCYINTCGGGETLIPHETVDYVRELLLEGHYVEIVTNGSLKKRFEEIVNTYPQEALERLIIKFSFHYEELVRLNLMDVFFENVHLVQQAGCSFTIEMTVFDSLVPKIPEIKRIFQEKMGTDVLCHLTVGRKDNDPNIPIMTDYSLDEYKNIWSSFDSDMFKFKLSTYYVKRKEFCYAGAWSFYLDLGNGYARKCYNQGNGVNIFQKVDEPIHLPPVGHGCKLPHCYNSHALLTFGLIPELDTPTYAQMRNRVDASGNEWLTPKVKTFFSSKLKDRNKEYSEMKKKVVTIGNRLRDITTRGNHAILRIVKKRRG